MIPPKDHPGWRKLLTEEEQHQFRFLALKFLMSRLQMKLAADSSPPCLEACVDELHDFAKKHEKFTGPDLTPLFR